MAMREQTGALRARLGWKLDRTTTHTPNVGPMRGKQMVSRMLSRRGGRRVAVVSSVVRKGSKGKGVGGGGGG